MLDDLFGRFLDFLAQRLDGPINMLLGPTSASVIVGYKTSGQVTRCTSSYGGCWGC